MILTDRGSEFTNPLAIEFNKGNGRRTHIFYCDPQRSDQKGGCEVTHEMIRRVLPKKTSFDNLTQDDINLMMSHINSYNRKKLNNQSNISVTDLAVLLSRIKASIKLLFLKYMVNKTLPPLRPSTESISTTGISEFAAR